MDFDVLLTILLTSSATTESQDLLVITYQDIYDNNVIYLLEEQLFVLYLSEISVSSIR